jgi:hypothetical protein
MYMMVHQKGDIFESNTIFRVQACVAGSRLLSHVSLLGAALRLPSGGIYNSNLAPDTNVLRSSLSHDILPIPTPSVACHP